jgi:hypothetical protein
MVGSVPHRELVAPNPNASRVGDHLSLWPFDWTDICGTGMPWFAW